MINFILIACPITCPANESCSCITDNCEKLCEDRPNTCTPSTSLYCVNKCYCNEGFIRSSSAGGACIPSEDCIFIWSDPIPVIDISE